MSAAAPLALPLRPPAHQVSPRAVRWWRLRAMLTLLVLAGPQAVVLLVLAGDAPGWLMATTVVTVVVGLAYGIAVPPLLYRIHRWEVTPEAVYTLSGWLVREWRIAPISRVQTVDTQRGPLDRLFGLANVTVTTASSAGAVHIVALDSDVADRVVAQLTDITAIGEQDAT
jgi:uncharacterized protein